MKTRPAHILIFLTVLLGSLFFTGPSRGAAPAAFVGEWCNKDFNTRANTRIRIYLDGQNLRVHMWGRCHPEECDWGETTATLSPDDSNTLLLTWSQGFATSTQKLTLQKDGSLTLSGTRTYKDKKRPAMKESGDFINGLQHDWRDAKRSSKK